MAMDTEEETHRDNTRIDKNSEDCWFAMRLVDSKMPLDLTFGASFTYSGGVAALRPRLSSIEFRQSILRSSIRLFKQFSV